MKFTIESQYKIGERVYLVTDPQQLPHLVTGLLVKANGVYYQLSLMGESMYYEDFEITKEKSIETVCGIESSEN